MAKLNLPTINSGYLSTEALNQAFSDISDAFENTLSRDGTLPNQMEADLDLNGFNIVNSGLSSTDPNSLVSYSQMTEFVSSVAGGIVVQKIQLFIATSGQTVFNLTDFNYAVGSNNLSVYVNGVRAFAGTDYTEADQDTVIFLAGVTLGAEVQFVSNEFLGNTALPAHTHPWSQITGVPVYATRWPDWTEVTGKPTTFPPSSHQHAAGDITSGRLEDARRGVYVQASQPVGAVAGDLWFW